MKTLEEILSILKENKDTLKKHFYIDKIGIFGSYSRQEQTSESDIDILVSNLSLEEVITLYQITNDAQLKPYIQTREYQEKLTQ